MMLGSKVYFAVCDPRFTPIFLAVLSPQPHIAFQIEMANVRERCQGKFVYFISSSGGRIDGCTKYTHLCAHLKANRYEQEAMCVSTARECEYR